jgi:DNA-directed RNA polymerase specialized sigma24 family protein
MINSLRESRKQVLRLYLTGLSPEEISELFDWDKTRVRHLLYRGIEELREVTKTQREKTVMSGRPSIGKRKDDS